MKEDIRIVMRPVIDFEKREEDSNLLVFQNETLRPILKMQHYHFKHLAIKYMPTLFNLSEELDRRIFCQNFLNKNPLITNLLIGMVMGMFTEKELSFFINHQSELSKRIKEMLIVRMADAA